MKRHSKTDLLEILRTQLRHFDESPDFGDAAVVAVIPQHLLVRIREAEGSSQTLARVHPVRDLQNEFRSEAA